MTTNDNLDDFLFISALENAVNFKGSANPKALIGKVMGKFPQAKSDMKNTMQIINQICEEVNLLSFEEQKTKLLELNPKAFEKKEKNIVKKDGLPNLEGTENGVVVRFEPAPSGHLHLGHLFPIVANYEFMKKYGGKFILRISDTNPDNIDIKNYEKVIEDVKWICEDDKNIEIVYQSDRLEIYYKYLRELVELGAAYICKCDSLTFKEYTDSKEKCPCNGEMDIDTQIKKYEKMFEGRYKSGEAVIRAKADVLNKNPALRSFPLARINENNHARVGNKYKVWPNMNLTVAIDDSLMGLTHVIRGKDHEVNMQRQEMIHKALNLKSPIYFHMGRMKFTDLNLSKTDLTKKIEDGEFSGWDDPRVPSILAYKKRGYRPEAFRKFILSLGITKRDSKITSKEYHKGLDFFNKQILEKESDRYFFVHNPKKVHITNLGDCDLKEIILPKHPTDKSKGNRYFKLSNEYFIDSIDFNQIEKEDLIRLMHFANFKVIEKNEDALKLEFLSKDYDKNLNVKRNIHFIPTNNKKCQIIMQDNSHLNGFCENLNNPKAGAAIQFERFGFVKYDSKENEIKNHSSRDVSGNSGLNCSFCSGLGADCAKRRSRCNTATNEGCARLAENRDLCDCGARPHQARRAGHV